MFQHAVEDFLLGYVWIATKKAPVLPIETDLFRIFNDSVLPIWYRWKTHWGKAVCKEKMLSLAYAEKNCHFLCKYCHQETYRNMKSSIPPLSFATRWDYLYKAAFPQAWNEILHFQVWLWSRTGQRGFRSSFPGEMWESVVVDPGIHWEVLFLLPVDLCSARH